MLFAVGSTLVNCTNSYDVEKPDPQMVELAKYAKQHVPEEHPKVKFRSSFLHQHHTGMFHSSSAEWLIETRLSFHASGCTFLCGEKTEEAAGGWCGVCIGLYGQTGESCPHRGL